MACEGDIESGIEYVNETSSLMGLESTTLYHRLKLNAENENINTTSVDDVSAILRGIYTGSLPGLSFTEPQYSDMIEILERSDFSFIKEGLPPGTLGGSKMGFDATLQAESAVINRKYMLTIYMKDVQIQDSKVIRDISGTIYELIGKK